MGCGASRDFDGLGPSSKVQNQPSSDQPAQNSLPIKTSKKVVSSSSSVQAKPSDISKMPKASAPQNMDQVLIVSKPPKVNKEIKVDGFNAKITYTSLMPPSDDFEITKVSLYECINEEDDTDFFGGIKLEWTHISNYTVHVAELILPRAIEIEADELTHLDYISHIHWAQGYKTNSCVAYFALKPYMADILEAGNAPLDVNIMSPSTDSDEKLQLHGLKIGQGGPQKRIVSVIPEWRGFSADETLSTAEEELKDPSKSPFLVTYKSANTEVFNLTKAYIYKRPEDIYLEYKYLITHGDYNKEYLGGLPVRFLAVDERVRLDKIVEDMKLESLMTFVKEKNGLYKQDLTDEICKQATALCVRVLREELLDTTISIKHNIRFAEKILTALYNDNEDIWKEVQKEVTAPYATLKSEYFAKVITDLKRDPNINNLLLLKNYKDETYATLNQKACSQKVDKGTTHDADQLIKMYIKEGGKIINDFHGLMRTAFQDKYLGAPVKQYERIRAKYEEYMKEGKSNTSDALANIMDFVRGSVICHTAQEMLEAVNILNQGFTEYGFQVTRIKNGFLNLEKENYKSILVNIVAFESLICEVQVTLKPMKTFNDIDHFLYEVLRENCLYNFVAKYLTTYTPFKDWLEPFLEPSMRLIFPEKYVTWKGFYVQDGTRGNMELKIRLSKDGSLLGYGTDVCGPFTLEGTHTNYKEATFVKTYQIKNGWTVDYAGNFVNNSTIEGTYDVQGSTGDFRLYVADPMYPGLSISASQSYNRSDKRKMRRREGLPDKEISWEGYWLQRGTQGDMKVNMRLGKDGKVTGSGTDQLGDFVIEGTHENYLLISFTKTMQTDNSWTIYYNGELDENFSIKGKYDVTGILGNFEFWIADTKYMTVNTGEAQDERYPMQEWQGYFVHEGEQGPMSMILSVLKDGTINGEGIDNYGSFVIEGSHTNFRKLTFDKTMTGPNGWTITYYGEIVSGNIIEGRYVVGESSGPFKIWQL